MIEEYDLVEDIRVKKKKLLFNKKNINILGVFIVFLILTALLFSTAYLYTNEKIAKAEAEEKAKKSKAGITAQESPSLSEIEKKLIKQLEREQIGTQ